MADTTFDDLTAAITDAVGKNPPPEDPTHLELMKDPEGETEPKKEAKKEPEVKKEEPAEPEHEVVDADPEEVKNALVFFRALNDPKQSAQLLATLAKNTGYDLSKKNEQKEFVRDAKGILREKLGDNFEILSGDGMAAAIEEIVSLRVKELVEQTTKPTLDRMAQAEKVENDRKAEVAMNDFFKRNDIAKEQQEAVAEKIFKKMHSMPPTPDTPVDTYLDDIYLLTHRDRVATQTVKTTVRKIKENAEERNSSGEGTGNEDRIKRGSAMPSLDEAVKAAYRGVRLDS